MNFIKIPAEQLDQDLGLKLFAKRIKRWTSMISESKKSWTAVLFPVINGLESPSSLFYIFDMFLFRLRLEAKVLSSHINPFHATGLFRYPVKTSENQRYEMG